MTGALRGMTVAALALIVAALAIGAGSAAAQERILSYDTEVEIRPDGSLEVAEHITVVAEGGRIRRGIYRDFPTRYRDRVGNRVRVRLEVIEVLRNGEPEPWFTERVSNGVRINTGDDSFLPVPAEYTFTIRYRTTRQLGFFDEHDELYWNAIGTGWIFDIERGETTIRLPEPVPVDLLSADGYTGQQGAQGMAWTSTFPEPGVARFALTSGLSPYEGFTIALGFPKGIVAEPTRADRIRWLLSDNRGVLVALAGLLVLLLFAWTRWHQFGRDPRPGVIVPRYLPPQGWSPGAIRYLFRGKYDDRCFSGDLLEMGVGGYLRIRQIGEGRAATWRVERIGQRIREAAASSWRPTDIQETLFRTLFDRTPGFVDLTDANWRTIGPARTDHQKALDEEIHGRYFLRNTKLALPALLITIVSTILAFLLSGGYGLLLIFAINTQMIIVTIVFFHLIRAPTQQGRAMLDQIEGLRLYLGVAEKEELAGLPGPDAPPPLDAARYEALLPYAVALGVEDAWTGKFTAAVGAAAAAAAAGGMAWYSGSGSGSDLGSFTRSVGSGLSSSIASSSSPPGSSSGGGGGGSSGGGGGGGGGGGR